MKFKKIRKEYSEKEVFGPNPTSPYYPLNKQEIESISIYQDEEAIELYGEKGNKGVVVIFIIVHTAPKVWKSWSRFSGDDSEFL